jgi:polyphosphate kinase
VPIFDKEIQKQLKEILNVQLNSNVKTRILDKTLSNQYVQSPVRAKKIRAQEEVYKSIFEDKQSYLKQNKLI